MSFRYSQTKAKVRLHKSKILYSQIGASFLYQTDSILGQTARIKVIRHLQYISNRIVINTYVQFAMLISACTQKEITPMYNCNFGFIYVKTDR